MSGSKDNQRRFRRVPGSFIVTYRLKKPIEVNLSMGGLEAVAVAVDISEGGMGVDSGQEIPVGSLVSLKFSIYNDLAVVEANRRCAFTLEAESRYCEPTQEKGYRAGLLFRNINPKERDFISEFVRDQSLRQIV